MEEKKVEVPLRDRLYDRVVEAAKISDMSIEDFCSFAIDCYALEVLGHQHHKDHKEMEIARRNKIDKLWLLYDLGHHSGTL